MSLVGGTVVKVSLESQTPRLWSALCLCCLGCISKESRRHSLWMVNLKKATSLLKIYDHTEIFIQLHWIGKHSPKPILGLPRWWRVLLPSQEMTETQIWSLGWEDPLEEEMATHSSSLAWEIPSTEEPGGLQSMGLQSQTPLSTDTFLTHTLSQPHPPQVSHS